MRLMSCAKVERPAATTISRHSHSNLMGHHHHRGPDEKRGTGSQRPPGSRHADSVRQLDRRDDLVKTGRLASHGKMVCRCGEWTSASNLAGDGITTGKRRWCRIITSNPATVLMLGDLGRVLSVVVHRKLARRPAMPADRLQATPSEKASFAGFANKAFREIGRAHV